MVVFSPQLYRFLGFSGRIVSGELHRTLLEAGMVASLSLKTFFPLLLPGDLQHASCLCEVVNNVWVRNTSFLLRKS